VHFLGLRDDIPELMNSADVLVHPARKEGFGLVLAEALAAGLPIVATDVGGIPEVLACTDALMVPPDDPLALREALLDVLDRTPEEALACRRKARQRAQFFRPERRIKDMKKLFHKLSVPKAEDGCE
jgi:glycosyltransferase involved in cell wall biosynthesis